MTDDIASIYDNAKQGHVKGIKLLVSYHLLQLFYLFIFDNYYSFLGT